MADTKAGAKSSKKNQVKSHKTPNSNIVCHVTHWQDQKEAKRTAVQGVHVDGKNLIKFIRATTLT